MMLLCIVTFAPLPPLSKVRRERHRRAPPFRRPWLAYLYEHCSVSLLNNLIFQVGKPKQGVSSHMCGSTIARQHKENVVRTLPVQNSPAKTRSAHQICGRAHKCGESGISQIQGTRTQNFLGATTG